VSNIVQQKLLQVQGVGNVELGGGALPAVRIEIDPTLLTQSGVSLEDVRTALQSSSANRPRGAIEGIDIKDGGKNWQIYAGHAAVKAADFAPMIVGWHNGAPMRLSDVASVQDGPEDTRTMGLFNGRSRSRSSSPASRAPTSWKRSMR
jgi:multidrug efflux pump